MSTDMNVSQSPNEPEVHLIVKCGNKTAAFFPNKIRRTGKTVGKCIRYQGKWMSPNEFETAAGVQSRKWKQSIKYNGKPLGDWLDENRVEHKLAISQAEIETAVMDTQECVGQCDVIPDLNTSPQRDNEASSQQCTSHYDNQGDNEHVETRHASLAPNNELSSINSVGESNSPQKLSPFQIEKVQCILSALNVQEIEGMSLDLVTLVLALGETVLKQRKEIEFMQQKLAIIEAQKENLTSRVIEETQHDPIEVQNACESLSEIEDSKAPKEGPYRIGPAQASEKGQLSELQTKIEYLANRQAFFEKEQEREKRKFNVLVGNVEEESDESASKVQQKVEKVFKENLRCDCKPLQTFRLGKRHADKNRLILVKLKSLDEKVKLLKAAKSLRGTSLFIMEDLSKSEREQRQKLVNEMKRERSEGNKAFIRYRDGKLIVNGKVKEVVATPGTPENPNQ